AVDAVMTDVVAAALGIGNLQLGIALAIQFVFDLLIRRPPSSTLFPYTTLFRSGRPGRAPERFLPLDITSLLLHVIFKGKKRSGRSEERFSRNAETDFVCRLLLEKKKENLGAREGVKAPAVVEDASGHQPPRDLP